MGVAVLGRGRLTDEAKRPHFVNDPDAGAHVERHLVPTTLKVVAPDPFSSRPSRQVAGSFVEKREKGGKSARLPAGY